MRKKAHKSVRSGKRDAKGRYTSKGAKAYHAKKGKKTTGRKRSTGMRGKVKSAAGAARKALSQAPTTLFGR